MGTSAVARGKLRVAIVGTGPAGMYAAQYLLERCDIDAEIDLYERLPTPWGLIRAGVAPDHPEKKMIVDRLFRQILAHSQVRFFGNLEIGRVEDGAAIGVEELSRWYSAVIFATGAGGDLSLNIPGEALPGSLSAREFVAWYNGHPDFRNLVVDLSGKRAVIVGNGNVALEVARILTLPIAVLEKTDIAEHALAALRTSQIEEVVILGRRGVQHCAFNTPELEELWSLDDVAVRIEGDPLPATAADWNVRRKLDVLRQLAQRKIAQARKTIVFRFLASPLAIAGARKVEALRIGVNRLQSDANGYQQALASGEESELATGLVLRAIGYRGMPFASLPFDARAGVIANVAGRVVERAGLYVTGWIKRGPKGIIGTNKKCARATVDALLDDFANGKLHATSFSREAVVSTLATRHLRVVDLQHWQMIERAEREAGRIVNRPRIKLTDVGAMLAVARSGGS